MGTTRDRIYRAAAALLTVVAVGCGRETAEPLAVGDTKEAALQPREVSAYRVGRRDFERTFRATGSLMPKDQARLRALGEGPIDEITVDIGDRVQKGQPLVQIRRIDMELALQAAQSGQATAEAGLRDLKAWRRPEEVAQTQAQLARARSEYERMAAERERARVLYERKSISSSEWDATRTAAEAAEEAMRAAEAQMQMATTGPTKEQIDVAETQVQMAASKVAQAQQMLTDTTLVAPYDGVITGKLRKRGDFVRRGEEVLEIAGLAVLEAEMNVPERHSGLIEPGLPVTVLIESAGLSRKGIVTAVSPSIDQQTRNFLVKVELDNSDFAIKAGAFGTAEFNLPVVKNALAVPTEAILSQEGNFFVWTVQDGKAHRANVILGTRDEEFTEVREGIDEGTLIVTAGQGVLAEGDPVKVAERAAELKPADATS